MQLTSPTRLLIIGAVVITIGFIMVVIGTLQQEETDFKRAQCLFEQNPNASLTRDTIYQDTTSECAQQNPYDLTSQWIVFIGDITLVELVQWS